MFRILFLSQLSNHLLYHFSFIKHQNRHLNIPQMPYRKCVSSILYCNFYSTSKNHSAALVLFGYNLIQKTSPKLLPELHLLPVKILQVHDEVCRNASLVFQSCTIYPIPHHLFLILHQFLQGFPAISANIPQTSVCK